MVTKGKEVSLSKSFKERTEETEEKKKKVMVFFILLLIRKIQKKEEISRKRKTDKNHSRFVVFHRIRNPSKGRRDFSSPFSLGWVSDSMDIDPICNSSRYLLEVVRRQILMLNQKA